VILTAFSSNFFAYELI